MSNHNCSECRGRGWTGCSDISGESCESCHGSGARVDQIKALAQNLLDALAEDDTRFADESDVALAICVLRDVLD